MNEHRLRTILLVIAVYHLVLGAFMFFAPGAFYDTLGKFPPRNDHYTKDVATFYIALGVVFFIAARRRSWRTPLLVFAALEYGLHAINHLVDVGKASSDLTGWFDFFSLALIALVFAALASFAWRVQPEEPAADAGPRNEELTPE
jgi:uncharacterized membrane protein YpjA